MDYKKYFYVLIFVFIISLLFLPIPFYYESCQSDYVDRPPRCYDTVRYFSGINYFFHKWIGEDFNVNEFHIPIWFVSNLIIALLIMRIIDNWYKRNGRFYSIWGMIFLIPFILEILILIVEIFPLRLVKGFDIFSFLVYVTPILLILAIIFGLIAEKKGDNKLGSKVLKLGAIFFILSIFILVGSSMPSLG